MWNTHTSTLSLLSLWEINDNKKIMSWWGTGKYNVPQLLEIVIEFVTSFFFWPPPLFFSFSFFCFLKDSNTNALIPVHSPIPNHFFPQSTEWMVSSWLFTGKNGQLFSIAAHLSAKNEVESSCSCDRRRIENDSPSSWFFWRALIKCLNAEIVLLISLPIPAVLGCKWGS